MTALEIHLQHRQAREMDKKKELLIIGVFFFALFGKFLYLPFDIYFGTSETWGYPFNPIKLSPGAYVDYSITWFIFAVIAFVHCFIVPKFRQQYFIIGCLFFLMQVEYHLNYNDPFSHWNFVPLSGGLYVGVCFIIWFFNVFKK